MYFKIDTYLFHCDGFLKTTSCIYKFYKNGPKEKRLYLTYLLHMDPFSGATEQNLSLGEGENNKKNEILLIFKNNLYKFPILEGGWLL